MTEINIITTDINSAEHIVSILENEALMIHGFIEKESSHRLPSKWKITAQTRAIFFDLILAKVKEIAPTQVLTVYSKPIVNMQWQQADLLLKTTKSA
jgi:hypothetical protein